MKINYDNIDETKPRWKVGDVIRDANGVFCLVSEVTSNDEMFYTLIDLEDGYNFGYADNINELQKACHDAGDMILNGDFKYIGKNDQGDDDGD